MRDQRDVSRFSIMYRQLDKPTHTRIISDRQSLSETSVTEVIKAVQVAFWNVPRRSRASHTTHRLKFLVHIQHQTPTSCNLWRTNTFMVIFRYYPLQPPSIQRQQPSKLLRSLSTFHSPLCDLILSLSDDEDDRLHRYFSALLLRLILIINSMRSWSSSFETQRWAWSV